MVRYKDNQKKRLKGKGVTKFRRKTETSSFWNASPADAAAVQQLQARVAELEAEVAVYRRTTGKEGNFGDNGNRKAILSAEKEKPTKSIGENRGAAVGQSERVTRTCSPVFDHSDDISASSQKHQLANFELDNRKTVVAAHGDCPGNQIAYEELGKQISTSSTDLYRENQRLRDEVTELRSKLADYDRQITAFEISQVSLRNKVDEQAEEIELCNLSIENGDREVIRLRLELDVTTEDAAEKDKLIRDLQKSSSKHSSEVQRLKQSVERLDQHICVLNSSETILRSTIEVQRGIIDKHEKLASDLVKERDAAIKEVDDKENTIDAVLSNSKVHTEELKRDYTQHLEKVEHKHQEETQKLQNQIEELKIMLAERVEQVRAMETRQERLLRGFQDLDSSSTGKRGANASTKQYDNRDMIRLTSELLNKMVSLLQKFRSIHSSSILRRQKESLIGLSEPPTETPEALSFIHKKLGETLTVAQHWKLNVEELQKSHYDKKATKGQESEASTTEKSSISKKTTPLRLKPILAPLSPSKSQRSTRSSVRGRTTTSEIILRRSKRSRSRSRDRTKTTKNCYDGKLSYDGRTLNLRNHLEQTVLSINSDEETN